ncbi:malate synthase A [Anaeromyxobacter sp. K]|uniref:malate synthase A n=1 Tax=Anaeromyxobacter sp. (strain K) TaxID=447217 RepID=UPI00015F8B3F|nr:malate synthase A [Anaeromyxobacter sp. K]ACG74318.1 malate synthase A [Anaeromyxobacter sp. K]
MPETTDAQRPPLPPGMDLRGPLPTGHETVLTADALAFVADLVRRFRPRVEQLLERRAELQRRWDAGERPAFLSTTEEIREAAWTVAPIPADLQDRRVEITGPTDRKMIINALNSGASVFMADFEDSSSPTWQNVVEGQVNLRDAVAGTIAYASPNGKQYRLKDRTAVLMVRPRGWHLLERHALVDGRAATAALWDFGVYFWNNARALVARGTGPYFYLPKLESHLEARLWNDVFVHAQAALGIPRGTIRATCLVETLPAAFEMDEILWELREHSAGLNCGRWDYIFSFVKRLRADPRAVLPDRAQVTMDEGFLRAYVQLLVQTCHRRGVHAMGGMAAQIPVKDDAAANEAALAKVRADKLREVTGGHDGTWVAHPGLVPVARAVFDEHMAGPNQIGVAREAARIGARDLLRPVEGTRTEAGLRHNVRVSVQYLEAWLRGSGCVPLYGLMEDAATAEISRALAWQWIHHGVALDDGQPLTAERFRAVLAEEMDRIRLEVGEARFAGGRFEEARALFERMSTQAEFTEFITLPAYDLLEARGDERARILAGGAPAGAASPAPHHPDPRRWEGIVRRFGRDEVERLRGSVQVEHTLARMGALRLWELLHAEPYVNALGALTGNQAVQMVKAGLKAIYLSGWQVAADANQAGQTYPDQSLYPANSVPEVVRRINAALQRADQIEHSEGRDGTTWFAPIVADAEAGFGGPLNAFELMKGMIEAGAAGVHFEDQVASEKKCGHLGGKVLVPTSTFIRTLTAARLAADVMDVPTIIVARTDAEGAKLIMSDIDPYDHPYLEEGERTPEGFYRLRPGIDTAIARGLAYAPFADLVWCETQTPDLHEAKRFAEGIHARFPGKLLAYNCSPSFNWKKKLDDATIARFQRELGAMGYKFQFVTLAGFHALNHSMFQLARGYRERGMAAYTELQQAEFAAEPQGYTATRHQREVGTGYFDLVAQAVSGGTSSTLALEGSTEAAQFHPAEAAPAHGADQVARAIEADHERLHALVARVRGAGDGPALSGALEELAQALREHFAHEEHAKGLYGIVGARSPARRAELKRMVEEHQQILRLVTGLVERARGPSAPAPADLGRLASEVAAQIADHERKELLLVPALA